MTNKNTSKNRPFMARQRERSNGKEEQGKQSAICSRPLEIREPARNNKGMTDGRMVVSSRNGKILNNIITSSSISSLIAGTATMAWGPTKEDIETQVRYPDKELPS